MTKVKNICAARNYTGSDGQERTAWNTIGKVFIGEDGKMWGIMDAVPVNWDGKFQLFDPKPNDATGKPPTTHVVKPKSTEPVDDFSGLPF